MALKPADARLSVYTLGPAGGAILAAIVGTLLSGVDGFQYDPISGVVQVHLETAFNALIGFGGGTITALVVYLRWALR